MTFCTVVITLVAPNFFLLFLSVQKYYLAWVSLTDHPNFYLFFKLSRYTRAQEVFNLFSRYTRAQEVFNLISRYTRAQEVFNLVSRYTRAQEVFNLLSRYTRAQQVFNLLFLLVNGVSINIATRSFLNLAAFIICDNYWLIISSIYSGKWTKPSYEAFLQRRRADGNATLIPSVTIILEDCQEVLVRARPLNR